MTRLLGVAMKDVKTIFRDRRALLTLLAQPVILIAVLGMALGPMFNSNQPKLAGFEVAVADADGGQLAQALVNDVLGSSQLDGLIKVRPVSADEARRLVQAQEVPAAVIIPAGFSAGVMSGEKAAVEVVYDPCAPTRSGIVSGIVRAFTDKVSAAQIAAGTALTYLAGPSRENGTVGGAGGAGGPTDGGRAATLDPAALAAQVVADVTAQLQVQRVAVESSTTTAARTVSAFDYYSVAMAVMFATMLVAFGSKLFVEERENRTLARLLVSPTRGGTIVAGKAVGVFVVGLMQFAVIYLFTHLVYRVDWGPSALGLAIMALVTVFAVTGLTIFCSAIFRSARSAEVGPMIITQIMAMLGGLMFPSFMFPSWAQVAQKLSPSGWAFQGFLNLLNGMSLASIVQPVLVLTLLGTVLISVGAWRLRLE